MGSLTLNFPKEKTAIAGRSDGSQGVGCQRMRDVVCVLWRVDSNHEMAFWKDF